VRSIVAVLLPTLAACPIEPDPDFVDPRDGLLFEWEFAGNPASVPDGSAHGYTLALEGTAAADGAAAFDGQAALGRGPDLAEVIPTLGALTLEARVRITDPTDDFTARPIVWVPQTAATGNFGVGLVVNTAARRLQFELVAGDAHVFVYRDQLYDDAWVTVHGTYDGMAAQLWVDGEAPVDAASASGTLDAFDFEFGAQVITVGGRESATERLGCEIRELRGFDRALSAEEVADRHARLSADD